MANRDIDKVHNWVVGDVKYGAPSFKSLPASPSISVTLHGFGFPSNLKIFLHQHDCIVLVLHNVTKPTLLYKINEWWN